MVLNTVYSNIVRLSTWLCLCLDYLKFIEQQTSVLNRAVSHTYWNMASIFSLFSSTGNVLLPKMMSCTVVTAGDKLCNIFLLCSTYRWQWKNKLVGSSFT